MLVLFLLSLFLRSSLSYFNCGFMLSSLKTIGYFDVKIDEGFSIDKDADGLSLSTKENSYLFAQKLCTTSIGSWYRLQHLNLCESWSLYWVRDLYDRSPDNSVFNFLV